MQSSALIVLFLSLATTEGLFWRLNRCPIRKYSQGRNIIGDDLLIDNDFEPRVKSVDNVAGECRVRVFIKGSYEKETAGVRFSTWEADLAIGHGFKFELRDEGNGLLCGKSCLGGDASRSEVRCFLDRIARHGLTWARYNPDIISDNTYVADRNGYMNKKADIQTKCQNTDFKRALLRALRRMSKDGKAERSDSHDNDDSDDSDDDNNRK